MKKLAVNLILLYLRFFARIQLAKMHPYIIGVGGASGKTSLSNFLYLILKNDFKVKQGKGKNSETGIPLDILGLTIKNYSSLDWLKIFFLVIYKVLFDWKRFDIYIAEMGIDSPVEPKNMSYLLKIIKPNTAVLTNISYEHSEYFESWVSDSNQAKKEEEILDLTAQQEALLLTSLKDRDIAVLNLDDHIISNLKNKIKAKAVTVSAKDSSADFYIEKIQNFVEKFEVTFKHLEDTYKIEIQNPLPKHFAYSFLLAIAASFNKTGDIKKAIGYLEKDFSLPPGRMSVFKGIKDTVIFDSSYNNATLTPILDLLDFVADIGRARRRVGIVGDMRELGTMSKTLHEQVANKILSTLDFVILIGPLTQKYIEPILKKHNFNYLSFVNFTAAKSPILESIQPKDMILVKGSQNTLFLERVVEMLLKDKADTEKLCRRGEFWDKIREKTL